ncbi:MAG: thioredoxin-dependent thiol peroxidase [Solirubrobacteraceae bacterium]
MSLPEIGQPAPDFTLPADDGSPVTLSDLRGGWVVLYFYPKASTPGCTTQACSIRDSGPEYQARGARVLGVSPDPQAKVAKFHDAQDLNFTLLADEDHAVCETYGTWVEKSMYGNKYMGASRTTIVIDPDGNVAEVFPKITPKQHDAKVLKALDRLQAA